jgi:hypothetical protein
MALLKEDGSLNIEWIHTLPVDEYIKVYGILTREQVDEYWSKTSSSHRPILPVIVDHPIEAVGVDAVDFLNKLMGKNEIECAEEDEICENEEQTVEEEMLFITIRHLNYPEATLWIVVPKREWQQATTMKDVVTLLEKEALGQTTEDFITSFEEDCERRTKIIICSMDKIRQQTDETNKEKQTNGYERLSKWLETIQKDQKSIIHDHIEHKNRITAKLEKLRDEGLLEITEKTAGDEKSLAPWEFVGRINLLLDLK